MPPKSAPVAPATSANRLVTSTIFSVSKPNAFKRLAVSISSALVNGVTAPKACNSPIIFFASSKEPVKTLRLLLCFSNSPAWTNANLRPANAPAAAAAIAAALPKPPTLCAAFLALVAIAFSPAVALLLRTANFLPTPSTALWRFCIAASAFLLAPAIARTLPLTWSCSLIIRVTSFATAA